LLDPVKWETHATPGLKGRPQGMINEELIPLSDFLIAVFRVRAGSPTGEDISGTIEEIREFMKQGKDAIVYFYEGDVPLSGIDPDQLANLIAFKREIQQHGITASYRTIDELRLHVLTHLTAIVRGVGAQSRPVPQPRQRQRGRRSSPSTGPVHSRKKAGSPRSTSAGASASAVVDTSGQWAFLGTVYCETQSVRHGADNSIVVQIPSRSAEIDASMAALRPHKFGRRTPIPFA
jgi:hypothetical protein